MPEIQEKVAELLNQGNYLAAITAARVADCETEAKSLLLGSIAEALITELDTCRRDQRERRLYLRSLLQMVLREVPGLGAIYRDQVRAATGESDPVQQLYRNFKTWGDVAAGKKTLRDGADDTAESMRQGFEDAGESMRSGELAENVQGFMNLAEQGVKAGLKSFEDMLNAGRSVPPGENRPQPDDPEQNQGE